MGKMLHKQKNNLCVILEKEIVISQYVLLNKEQFLKS